MAFPLISIVVPVCNAGRTLKRCVDSLVSQTFADIEILLVNNGSVDDSLVKCRELSSSDTRIKVVDHIEKGVSSARNRGIEESVGEYVMFVDADDWVDSNVCEIFAELNTQNNYDLFCFSAQYHKTNKSLKSFLFTENVELFTEKQKEELQIKIFAPNAPYCSYKTNTRFLGSVWGKIYKREILIKNKLHFATETIISEDCLFNTLALDSFQRIGYTRDCFYHYVQQDNSAQNSYRPNSEKYFGFLIVQIQQWLQQTRKNQKFVDAANSLFVHYLFGFLKEDLLHKDNLESIREKKQRLEMILSTDSFRIPLNAADGTFFSFPERILVWLLRKKQIGIIFFILKFIK